jgi:hypothetical protein
MANNECYVAASKDGEAVPKQGAKELDVILALSGVG